MSVSFGPPLGPPPWQQGAARESSAAGFKVQEVGTAYALAERAKLLALDERLRHEASDVAATDPVAGAALATTAKELERAHARAVPPPADAVTLEYKGISMTVPVSQLRASPVLSTAATEAQHDGTVVLPPIAGVPAEAFEAAVGYLRTGTVPSFRRARDRERLLAAAHWLNIKQLSAALEYADLDANLGAYWAAAKRAEDAAREAFAAGATVDPAALLVELSSTPTGPRSEPFSVPLPAGAVLFEEVADQHTNHRWHGTSIYKVRMLDRLTMIKNFFGSSDERLAAPDFWANLFVAGGAVLNSVLPHDLWTASDVDLFVYGLDAEAASAKAKQVWLLLEELYRTPMHAAVLTRTLHAVNINGKGAKRKVQIITRLHASPAEVLASFDLDCCCVGFDGTRVVHLPRWARAISQRANVVDATHQSDNYEMRLLKYAYRGFAVAVPQLRRELVDAVAVYTSPFKASQGLARLLQLEAIAVTSAEPNRHNFHGYEVIKRIVGYAKTSATAYYQDDLDYATPYPKEELRWWQTGSFARFLPLFRSRFEQPYREKGLNHNDGFQLKNQASIVIAPSAGTPEDRWAAVASAPPKSGRLIPDAIAWATTLPQHELVGSLRQQDVDFFAQAYGRGLPLRRNTLRLLTDGENWDRQDFETNVCANEVQDQHGNLVADPAAAPPDAELCLQDPIDFECLPARAVQTFTRQCYNPATLERHLINQLDNPVDHTERYSENAINGLEALRRQQL